MPAETSSCSPGYGLTCCASETLWGSVEDGKEPRTLRRLPPRSAELHATFLFLVSSDGLGAQRVLSSEGTEDDLEVVDLL